MVSFINALGAQTFQYPGNLEVSLYILHTAHLVEQIGPNIDTRHKTTVCRVSWCRGEVVLGKGDDLSIATGRVFAQ